MGRGESIEGVVWCVYESPHISCRGDMVHFSASAAGNIPGSLDPVSRVSSRIENNWPLGGGE